MALTRLDKGILAVDVAWAGFVVLVTLMKDGLSGDNVTRGLVLAYLAVTLGVHLWRGRRGPRPALGRAGFLVSCCASALVVEAFYMPSRPVFASLRFTAATTVPEAVQHTLLDWCFTLPAYIVLYAVVWALVQRYRYGVGEYVVVFSLAQALGDGSAFFLASPGMLLLIPYTMTNYQAINVIPWLRARPGLTATRRGVMRFIAPLVIIPCTYWLLGALILTLGRRLGF